MGEHKVHHSYLIFMLLLSLFALAALAIETVLPLDEETHQILSYADAAVCVLFFIDFLISLVEAKNKWKYMTTWGWLDLISSIPAIEPLRLGRAARIVRILRVLRSIRAARVLSQFILEKRAQSAALAALLLAILLVFVSSIAIIHFEAGSDGNIKTAEDAVWWSIATITTVSYGDKYPTSPEGKALAAMLMVAGIGLFATLSGLVASWFLSTGQEKDQSEFGALRAELAELRTSLAAINQALRQPNDSLNPPILVDSGIAATESK